MGPLSALFVASLTVFAASMADDSALREVAQGESQFANHFAKTLADDQTGNLICSPLSAQVVLAMAAYGAGGTTAAEMRSVLRLPTDDVQGQRGFKSLIELFNSVTDVDLRLANKVYTADSFEIKPAYKELTANKFHSTSEEVDFANSAAAVSTINAWCAAQTNDRIKDILTPDSVDGDTKLVLVNAVYFKGQWLKQFDPSLTIDRPFHVDTKTVKNVSTMYIKGHFKFGDVPDMDARFIELPYKGNQLSMIIILPNEVTGLARVQNNMQQMNISEILKNGWSREVELFLPKFKFESTLNLNEVLTKMGMGTMFTNTADFSGISDVPLKVSKVIQKAFIEVNEEGSEAAAVTVSNVFTRILEYTSKCVEYSENAKHKYTFIKKLQKLVHRKGKALTCSEQRVHEDLGVYLCVWNIQKTQSINTLLSRNYKNSFRGKGMTIMLKTAKVVRPSQIFKVDHPASYAIINRDQGIVLFSGYLQNPTLV